MKILVKFGDKDVAKLVKWLDKGSSNVLGFATKSIKNAILGSMRGVGAEDSAEAFERWTRHIASMVPAPYHKMVSLFADVIADHFKPKWEANKNGTPASHS